MKPPRKTAPAAQASLVPARFERQLDRINRAMERPNLTDDKRNRLLARQEKAVFRYQLALRDAKQANLV